MRTDRPGYQNRQNKDGSVVHYWNPKRAVTDAPAYLSTVRLADDLTSEEIAHKCAQLTADLRNDLNNLDAPSQYDGSISSLIKLYRSDETSTYHRIKHSSRRDYEASLLVLEKNVGDRSVRKLKASDFSRWFDQWRKTGHRRATGAIKLLRIILSYGTGERMRGCSEARGILSLMKFEQPPARDTFMTYQQCEAIVLKSAELGCPSIGFVEAIKFETALRRIDVIGEWIESKLGRPFQWRGLTAMDISDDMILTVKTSKTKKEIAHDLKVMPLVGIALKAYKIPLAGPIVINENTGRPYLGNRYSVKFRKVRDAAGVPSTIWSMDTRAGAITEALIVTGSIEEAQNLATHSSPKMTRRYARGNNLIPGRKVAGARSKSRE